MAVYVLAAGCMAYLVLSITIYLIFGRQVYVPSTTYLSACSNGAIVGVMVALSKCVVDAARFVSVPANAPLSSQIGVLFFYNLPVVFGFGTSAIFAGAVATQGTTSERITRIAVIIITALVGCFSLLAFLRNLA